MFTIDTPNYLLFIKKQAEIDNVKKELKSELDFNKEWTLYTRNYVKVSMVQQPKTTEINNIINSHSILTVVKYQLLL